MPQKKLDKTKIAAYEKQLLKLQEGFVHDINNMSQSPLASQSDAGHVQHLADVATDMYDREFNLGLASNERAMLQQVEGALKRIQKDVYGICLKCEKPIPAARLKALPYAENCMKCQEIVEQEQ